MGADFKQAFAAALGSAEQSGSDERAGAAANVKNLIEEGRRQRAAEMPARSPRASAPPQRPAQNTVPAQPAPKPKRKKKAKAAPKAKKPIRAVQQPAKKSRARKPAAPPEPVVISPEQIERLRAVSERIARSGDPTVDVSKIRSNKPHLPLGTSWSGEDWHTGEGGIVRSAPPAGPEPETKVRTRVHRARRSSRRSGAVPQGQVEVAVRFPFDAERNEHIKRYGYRWDRKRACWSRSFAPDVVAPDDLRRQAWFGMDARVEAVVHGAVIWTL